VHASRVWPHGCSCSGKETQMKKLAAESALLAASTCPEAGVGAAGKGGRGKGGGGPRAGGGRQGMLLACGEEGGGRMVRFLCSG